MQKVTVGVKDINNQFYSDERIYSKFGLFTLPQNALCRLQFHNVCEVAICREGNGLWFTAERVYSISEGDIILAPPFSLHHTRSVKDDCRCEFAYFDEKSLLERNGIRLFARLSSDIFGCATIFRKDKHPRLHFLLKNFIEAANNRSTDSKFTDNASALWYSLFLLELQSSEPSENKQLEKRINISSVLMPAIEKIVLNFSDQLTLEELAAACSLSRNRFIERFKREYGTTPTKYLNNYRVNTAAQMLSEGTDKIIDICTFVGYNHPSELLRNFKQRYGLSPSEYRNKTKLDSH